MPFTLASASELVQIWDIEAHPDPSSTSSLHQLVPPAHPTKTITSGNTGPLAAVHALQWNHNNAVLATANADGYVTLNGVADGKVIMKLPNSTGNTPLPTERVCALGFSTGSRYLCSSSGTVLNIWDLKHPERAPRKLTGHTAEVLALDLGQSDALVASCGRSGEILLHNVTQASISAKLVSDGGQELTDIQFSLGRPNLLGAVGESGVVQIWDVTTSSIYASIRPSSNLAGAAGSPLAAIRFSTTSPNLFASVGGKHLCFYDISSKKCIRDITTDYFLSCIDYHFDGCSLALGTSQGHVLMYDIRAASKPLVKILNAHVGKQVNAVKFQHQGTTKKTTITTATPSATTTKTDPTPNKSSNATTAQPSSSHVNQTLPAPSAAINNSINSTTSNGSFVNQTAPPATSTSNGVGGNLFSPIKSTEYASDPTLLLTPLSTNIAPFQPSANNTASGQPPSHLSSNLTTSAAPPRSLATNQVPSHLSLSTAAATSTSSSTTLSSSTRHQPPHLTSSIDLSDAPVSRTNTNATNFDSSVPHSPKRRTESNYDSSSSAASNQQLILSPHRRPPPSSPSTFSSASIGGGVGMGGIGVTSATGLNDYQVSLLKSMLDESLYSLRSEFTTRLNDMHMEMIKQFHLNQLEQQRSMDLLISRFEDMVHQVKELRQEYTQPRPFY